MDSLRRFFLTLLTSLVVSFLGAQVVIIPTSGTSSMPEHGFLPGKKFKYYPTIKKYDFKGLKVRVELNDDRKNLNLRKTNCSDVEFTNTSEFADPQCIYKVRSYIDTLFKPTGAVVDSTANDTIKVWLEGIDARLIGVGYIRAHGLCQMKIKYQTIEKIYCIDITDADANSPIGKNAFVTRLTATRIIASAAMREVIEQFFEDLKKIR